MLEVRSEGFVLDVMPVGAASELEEGLREAFDARSDRTLLVQAPGDVAYRRLLEALDLARGAGAERIGLVDPASAGEGEGRSRRSLGRSMSPK